MSPFAPPFGLLSSFSIYRFREKRFQDLRREFLAEFEEAVRLDEALAPHLGKAQDDLNPIRVLHIFSKMVPEVPIFTFPFIVTLSSLPDGVFVDTIMNNTLGLGATGYECSNSQTRAPYIAAFACSSHTN